MKRYHVFAFNHYAVNTVLLWDKGLNCVIIDPACTQEEQHILYDFIADKKLIPVYVLLTHAHPDHVVGLDFVCQKYSLPVTLHEDAQKSLFHLSDYGKMLGFDIPELSQIPTQLINEGDPLCYGEEKIQVLYCPGHALGSLCYYFDSLSIVVTGDVLFKGSIGRSDLPGGDYDQLMSSIQNKLLVLPNSTFVFPGHGPKTTIQEEIQENPFLQG